MISLCLIVKNEEAFLENCLRSAAGYFDDIVVVDTGSDDATKAIAVKYGARVYDFKWIADFSAARNFSASHAKHDWIFSLDADEVILSFDTVCVSEFIKDAGRVGSVKCFDTDVKSNEVMMSSVTRLYNRKVFGFAGRIHEQIKPLIRCTPYRIEEIPVKIEHYGYQPEIVRQKNKLERNRQMLSDELALDPDNLYLLYQLGKAYFGMSEDMNMACEYFEKAMAINPKPALEYVYTLIECYGYALLRCGRYADSLKVLEYMKYYSNNPCFIFLSAHIYLNNGMLTKAVECFESCIGSNDGERPGIGSYLSYYNIAVILEVVGMINEAKMYYQKCGDYKPAAKMLKHL